MVNRNIWILRVSCLLSIMGSIIVMIACRFPKKVWKKKGRQLIFWLSVSDVATSIVYFFASFDHTSDKNSQLCQTTGLLGIFFPVASFIWTDFIGYYLYTMIRSRKLPTDKDWENLMRWFHILSWGIAGLCITFVGGFGHAGRSDNKNNSENTGGWCWVATSKYSNLILWEIIGGKCVEWLSCFIILPYLYYSTAKTLIQLDLSTVPTQQSTQTKLKPLQLSSPASQLPPSSSSPSGYSNSISTSDPHPSLSMSSNSYSHSISQSSSQSPLALRPLPSSSPNGSSHQQETLRNPKFQKFYIKMAIVPILFFFCRLWGTLRIFLYLAYPDSSSSSSAHSAHHAADTWLYLMQAIFDPLQGFFNSILFVFLSAHDRQNIVYLFCIVPYCYLMGREIQPLPEPSYRPHHNTTPSFKNKKKLPFLHRLTSYLYSSSSVSTSLLNPMNERGRGGDRENERGIHMSSSQRSDDCLGEGVQESEEVGLSRISESGTLRDSEVYNGHTHPHAREISFAYDTEYQNDSEYSR